MATNNFNLPPPTGDKPDGVAYRDWFYKLRDFFKNATFGTVSSVDVSGGTTGLTTSGGPVTTTGTITLAGTLNYQHGGTGLTTLGTANQVLATNAGATAIEWHDSPLPALTATFFAYANRH